VLAQEALEAERLGHPAPRRRREPLAQRRVVEQPRERGGRRRDVAGRDQESAHVVLDQLVGPAAGGRDDRHAERHRLDQGIGDALAVAARVGHQDRDGGVREQILGRLHEAGEVDARGEAERRGALLDRRLARTAASQHEAQVGARRGDARERLEQRRVVLLLRERRRHHDEAVAGSAGKRAARLRAPLRADLEAAGVDAVADHDEVRMHRAEAVEAGARVRHQPVGEARVEARAQPVLPVVVGGVADRAEHDRDSAPSPGEERVVARQRLPGVDQLVVVLPELAHERAQRMGPQPAVAAEADDRDAEPLDRPLVEAGAPLDDAHGEIVPARAREPAHELAELPLGTAVLETVDQKEHSSLRGHRRRGFIVL